LIKGNVVSEFLSVDTVCHQIQKSKINKYNFKIFDLEVPVKHVFWGVL